MNPAVQAQIDAALSDSPPNAPSNWRNDGKQFEREMEATAGAYQSRRVATLKKVDPPVRVFMIPDASSPTGKRQRVVFLANPHLDYCGAWTARFSRALFVEAKSTSTHRLKFADPHGAGLKAEQWAAMKTWRMAGAACCLVWKFGERVALFTPDDLMPFEARGDKSIQFESGRPVPRGIGTVIWDFLPVLERAIWPDKTAP